MKAVRTLVGLAAACVLATAAAAEPARELAVCADPANLPFSNQRGEGFENRIAELLADELHATLRYAWNMQRRSFLRRTLLAGACDLVLGAPPGLQGLQTTRPYYRSGYVFVSRRARLLDHIARFDDPALKTLTIGLHALGAEGANPPPAMLLAGAGLGAQVRGYPMWGEEPDEAAPGRLIQAVARGEVDIAIAWGPIAGYYAKGQAEPLALVAAEPDAAQAALPVAFDIAMGVRRGDESLRDEVQAALDRRAPQIRSILAAYGVPAADPAPH
ncbi:quinoprotein dehydrogenase-associated putative ABC transporter substrate-binding protein [Ideonella sp. YS5]|uniref:quinoprotein dehydrogenase-associated putative ABC transporter substrate-binding protein n=1 Tax=Ideonella sp. YS5 TaxID=3453714 RepID=UPI003EEC367A